MNLAEHGTAGFLPVEPHQFVGAMWFRTSGGPSEPPGWVPNPIRRWITAHPREGWYFPKYPLGLPALNAIVFRSFGRPATLAVSPAAMTLAALGVYVLAVNIVAPFFALLAMLALMFGPTTLQLAELPNSHAVDLCAVVWGMVFLLRWWRHGRVVTGLLAGLLLGVAVTFRYSEALLLLPLYPLDQILADTGLKAAHPWLWRLIGVLRLLPIGPLGVAVLWRLRPVLRRPPSPPVENTVPLDSFIPLEGEKPVRVRFRHARRVVPALTPMLGWAVPVGVMLIVSWFTTGHLTGYDATHESAGFSTADFLKKWDFTIFQLLVYGLLFTLPIGLVGLITIFSGDRRTAWLLLLWFLPGALLYTAYYWGEDVPGVGYLRFFLSLYPPVLIAAAALLARAARRDGSDRHTLFGLIGSGAIITASAAVGLWLSLPELTRQQRGNLNLAYSTREISSIVKGSVDPALRPILFVDDGLFPQLAQHLQFMLDADVFASDAFEPRTGGGFGIFGVFQQNDARQNNPVLLQPERIEYMDQVNKGKTPQDFVRMEQTLITSALRDHRPVYLCLTPPQAKYFRQRVKNGQMKLVEKRKWSEPCADHRPDETSKGANGRPSSAHSPLDPPNWSGEPLIRWHPQTLELLQVLSADVGP